MKSILNSILNLFQLEIHKKTSKNLDLFPKNHPALHIEFIGVSGVGKSSIYNNLKQSNRIWWTTAEFIKSIGKIDADDVLEQSSLYQKIAKYRLNSIQSQHILSTLKFRIAHWNYRSLQEDILINQYNENALIISEEGLLHNFSDELIKLYDDNPNEFKLLLKNRAVIYCHASAKEIVQRIEKRTQETGRTVAFHRGKNKEELFEIVEKQLESKEKIISLLISNEVPMLRISTEDNIIDNSKKISDFIKEIQSKENS